MRYSIVAILLGLGACTAVPGAALDAQRIGATAVYSAASIADQVLGGAEHVLSNAHNDLRNTARSLTGQ